MRITNSHRGHNTNLTKCTKMTEGEHRIHGMNGGTDSGSVAATKEECPQASDAYNLGGRLKFFKNGRFILELARAREGEKVAWVPVPKKTFWPPQGSASSVSTYRQESSTSLSVSDDNSSVQSSPWQRDHTWKQTTPQRNASSHLSFCYVRRGSVRATAEHSCWRYRVQRSPYTPCPSEPTTTGDHHPQQPCNRCTPKGAHRRPTLVHVVQVLWNKSLQALNSITSPRKRILRELERVTIDDLSYKRCRGKVQQPAGGKCAPPPATAAPVVGPSADAPAEVNGTATDESQQQQRGATAASAKNCSYSITSLLGGTGDSREDKLSSQYAPRITAHHPAQQPHRTGAAPGEDAVDGSASRPVDHLAGRKRSPLTVAGSPSVPSSPADPYAQAYPAHHPAPYVSPYAVYPALGHHGYVTPYYSAAYGRGAPGYYPALAHPAVASPLARHDQAPYSWTVPAASYEHALHRDDTISDVPLNLSKHAD